jgi:hypothetical protein
MDLLVPGIGEIIGGSQREERMSCSRPAWRCTISTEKDYWWYLDLRRYGTVPHAGFGLGFERMLMFVTGVANIRDVIPFARTPGHGGILNSSGSHVVASNAATRPVVAALSRRRKGGACNPAVTFTSATRFRRGIDRLDDHQVTPTHFARDIEGFRPVSTHCAKSSICNACWFVLRRTSPARGSSPP